MTPKSSLKKIIDKSNVKFSKSLEKKELTINNQSKDLLEENLNLKKALSSALQENKRLYNYIKKLKLENSNLESLLAACKDEIEEKDEVILELANVLKLDN